MFAFRLHLANMASSDLAEVRAMELVATTLPESIFIGTSKRFARGAARVWKYNLVSMGTGQV